VLLETSVVFRRSCWFLTSDRERLKILEEGVGGREGEGREGGRERGGREGGRGEEGEEGKEGGRGRREEEGRERGRGGRGWVIPHS
jgi:hypothetical protein